MLCNSYLRSVSFLAGDLGRHIEVRQIRHISGVSCAANCLTNWWKHKCGTMANMMVDSIATAKGSVVDVPPEKLDDGSYVSGGWKR